MRTSGSCCIATVEWLRAVTLRVVKAEYVEFDCAWNDGGEGCGWPSLEITSITICQYTSVRVRCVGTNESSSP